MSVSVSNEVLIATAIASLIWLILRHFVEGRLRKSLLTAEANGLSRAAARLSGVSFLRSVAACGAIAGLIVIAGTALMQAYMSGLEPNTDGLAAIVDLRDRIERGVDAALFVSIELWVLALVVLALIWFFAVRSRSRRQWSRAIDSRRAALSASLEGQAGSALREAAVEANPEGVARLDQRLTDLHRRNVAEIERVLDAKVLRLGEEGNAPVSMNDMTHFVADLRTPSTAEEAAEAGMTQAEVDSARQKASAKIEEQLAQLRSGLEVTVETLQGPRKVQLAEAMADMQIAMDSERDIDNAMRALVVDARMRTHEHLGNSKARSEPEILREWIAAVTTGEAAVRAGSWMGRWSRRVVLVAIFVGLVGLGARVSAPGLISEAKALEVSFSADMADRDLAEAVAASDDESPDAIDDEALASDAETVMQLQNAMRISAARALQAGQFGRNPVAVLNRRQRFELATVEARQRILQASARPAAVSLDQARPRLEIRASVPEGDAVRQFNAMLDESMQRRIEVLRSHEPTWRRLRASATRAAPVDLVSDQFMRAALPGQSLPAPHAMRSWTERATRDFAVQAARSGDIAHGHVVTTPVHSVPDFISARDRRLLADYESRAPRNVAKQFDDLHAGRIDPGSLHRAMPNAPIRPGGSGSAYADLFPAVSQSTGGGGGGFGGTGDSSRPKASGGGGGSRVATARSFSRIRFNPRVGGVVIGRLPDDDEQTVSVTGFNWQLIGENQIEISLTTPDFDDIPLGRFHAAIAHHALAYAADGRVVTSTLPQVLQPDGDPSRHVIEVPTRQVVVHPAFEDTAFACPAIEVDRFVDGFLYGSDSQTADHMIEMREAVTLFGRILEFVPNPDNHPDIAGLLPDLAPYVKDCGTGDRCFPIDSYERSGFDFGGASVLLECIKSESQPDVMCMSALGSASETQTAFSVDSGVRELPYSLDPELTFLQRSANAGDPLWPLDFIVQAMPISLTETPLEIPDDLEPWVFPAMRAELRKAIEQSILRDPASERTLNEMQQFTVLQRLFRLALNGNLGLEFPLHELIAMQEATQPFVRVQRHEHWNINHAAPHPAFLETIGTEEVGLVSALRQISRSESASAECRNFANEQVEAQRAASWPEGASLWPTVGKALELCRGAPGFQDLDERLAELRRLDLIDEALAISEALGKPRPPGCPPL